MTYRTFILDKVEVLPRTEIPVSILPDSLEIQLGHKPLIRSFDVIPVILTVTVGLSGIYSQYARTYYAANKNDAETIGKFRPDVFSERKLETLIAQEGELTFEDTVCCLPDNLPSLILDYYERCDF